MRIVKGRVAQLVADERGEDLIEYGLLVSFVAGVALAVIISDPFGVSGALKRTFQKAKDALDNV